jgi:hypothetical protein
MSKSLQFPVALIAALLLAPGAASAAAVDEPPAQAADLAGGAMNLAGVEHELRIEETPAGAETLMLTARLKAGGDRINRPIGWTLRQDGTVSTDPSAGRCGRTAGWCSRSTPQARMSPSRPAATRWKHATAR